MDKVYLNESVTPLNPLSTLNEKILIEKELKDLIFISTGKGDSGGYEAEDVVVVHPNDLLKVIDALILAYNDSHDIPFNRLTDEDRLPEDEREYGL